ncbi:MAG TPA: PilZ domain-containing protein, partial [Kineosporiaceae bacterium]|nr:PilZ domain-containing protein [Kineosporiaceae bacterium]
MVAVASGDRVVLRTDDGYVALRVLRGGELVGPWRVDVLALVGRVHPVSGVLEIPTVGGPVVRLPARLAILDGAVVLQAGRGDAPTGTATSGDDRQRRGDVRGELHLPVRVAAVDRRGEEALQGGVLAGHTLDVSAGGARLDLPGLARRMAGGCRLYVEFELPEGQIAPAVVAVVRHTPPGQAQVR